MALQRHLKSWKQCTASSGGGVGGSPAGWVSVPEPQFWFRILGRKHCCDCYGQASRGRPQVWPARRRRGMRRRAGRRGVKPSTRDNNNSIIIFRNNNSNRIIIARCCYLLGRRKWRLMSKRSLDSSRQRTRTRFSMPWERLTSTSTHKTRWAIVLFYIKSESSL